MLSFHFPQEQLQPHKPQSTFPQCLLGEIIKEGHQDRSLGLVTEEKLTRRLWKPSDYWSYSVSQFSSKKYFEMCSLQLEKQSSTEMRKHS